MVVALYTKVAIDGDHFAWMPIAGFDKSSSRRLAVVFQALFNANVAQLVERPPCKLDVAGSIPAISSKHLPPLGVSLLATVRRGFFLGSHNR